MSVSIGDITGRVVIDTSKGSVAVKQFGQNFDVAIKNIQVSGNRFTSMIEGMVSKAALLAGAGLLVNKGFAFLKSSAAEAMEAERAIAQLRAGVESTGAAAGKSVEELSAMADELSKLTGFDDEMIAAGEAILLTFRRVRGEAFEQTMRLALDLSARFGKDIDSSVVMIAKALDQLMAGSAKGLSALSKAGVTFTAGQKKQLEALVKTGQGAEAQRLFFRELELQFGGSAKAARDTMGGAVQALAVSWSNFKEAVGSSGTGFRVVIEMMIKLVERFTLIWQKADLGITIVLLGLNEMIGALENRLQSLLVTLLSVSNRATQINPFASDEQKIRAQVGLNNAILEQSRKRVSFAERSRNLEAEIAQKTMSLLGILPKVQSSYSDTADEIEKVKSKTSQWFDDLYAQLARQTQALELFRKGLPVERVENLVEAAEGLGRTNLLDPLVLKAGIIKDRIDAIATAFRLADDAKKKFAEAGDDLDKVIEQQFSQFGGNDPEMQKLVSTLQEAKTLTDSLVTAEEKRLSVVVRAQQLYEQGFITQEQLQALLLANADQWNQELDKTQELYQRIFERISYVADSMAFDLVNSWRTAWEQNESITDATLDSLKSSMLNVLQDIISEWLSKWFRAMAAWLARWIAIQASAKTAQAGLGTAGASGAGGGVGSLLGMGQSAAGASGASTSAMLGAGLAAFGLYVIYKGFIEDHARKFARVTISDGAIGAIQTHGKKYLDGVTQAAEQLLANLETFLSEVNVTMTRLGTVIIEASKHGVNVSMGATSTGKLFASMEEAMSYAQVLMLKYGEFADSVSLLVRSVIQNTKAISMEQLAADIDFAKLLDTQNLDQVALSLSKAMETAISQWEKAEELFLSFYSTNLPAFEAAVDSIVTKLTTDLRTMYNNLAGIEEDPKAAWERQRVAYNAQRAIILAQMKLWELEIAARIANYNAQARILGGGGGKGGGPGESGGNTGGSGLIGIAERSIAVAVAMTNAAGLMDPALQALLDIQAQLIAAQADMPPPLDPGQYPGKRRGRRGNKGGGGAGTDTSMRDWIDDKEFELAARALDEYHRAVLEKEREYQDKLAELGKKDEKQRSQLIALRERELALMAEEQRRSVSAEVDDFTDTVNQFDQVRRTAEALVESIRNSPFGDAESAAMIGRVFDEMNRQIDELANQSIVSLFGSLLSDMEKFGASEQQMSAARKHMMSIEHTIKMEHYRKEIEAIKLLGKFAPEVIAALEDSLRYLGTIDVAKFVNEGITLNAEWLARQQAPIGTAIDDAAARAAKALEDAAKKLADDIENASTMLTRYQRDQMDPLARAILEINGDFAEIRRVLGNTPEVLAAYNAAISIATANAQRNARDLLAKYNSLPLDPLAERLLEITNDFAEIRRVLGDTPEVMSSFAAAMARAQKEAADLIAQEAEEAADKLANEVASNIRSMVETWRGAVESLAQSTRDLLTDESLTNLTQAEQLEYARAQLAQLASKAQAGDLEALANLDAARREFLAELRESEGGGFGYDTGFEWAMKQTADVLANAQAAEGAMIANELAKTTAAWADIMERLSEDITGTFYDAIDNVVFAIYDAIGSVPSFASGGVVMSGPRLVRVAEYVPEAIVPLDRLASMVPYRLQQPPSGNNGHSKTSLQDYWFAERDTLSRLSSLEESNNRIAQSLTSIKSDIGKMSRGR